MHLLFAYTNRIGDWKRQGEKPTDINDHDDDDEFQMKCDAKS